MKVKAKPRLFVDMDGTLYEWRNIRLVLKEYEDVANVCEKINEILTRTGYYITLRPHIEVMDAIRQIINEGEIEVFVMTCVLPDSEDASPRREKHESLDRDLPELDRAHRIFVPDGENKADYVPGGIRSNDFLLDDYTHNLSLWSESGEGIKLLNAVNSSKNTWEGSAVNYKQAADLLAMKLKAVILSGERVRDQNPPKDRSAYDLSKAPFLCMAKQEGEEEKEP